MQLGFVVVRGRSMEPTYVDGDVVLVAWGASPRVGRCHVVRLPDGDDGPRPLAIKRVTRRERLADGASGWWVERDNPREGVDSWLVGALGDEAMRGRVVSPDSPVMTQ
ncbi:MAG: peptidase S24, partial [Dermacoccus nishinomiyaensis]